MVETKNPIMVEIAQFGSWAQDLDLLVFTKDI